MAAELEKLLEFTRYFDYKHANDREIVIVGCAYIESLVKEIIKATFIPDEKEAHKLLNESAGALSSLVPRARLLYLLGVIPEVVYKDIQTVGRIRNEFAHKVNASFTDNTIVQLCGNLQWHIQSMFMQPPPGVGARNLYQVGVNQLVTYLVALPNLQRSKREKTN
ncbi:MltR family transcriptional regulator [Methylomonas koyamae]|uniref:MltR family transcriptional regulator n=1 Tax=Methylomonas koyamae TaxID=702114 RepID=UPI000B25F2C9|nr:MltR family transcriptional regulator [Methylomonas koyamae]